MGANNRNVALYCPVCGNDQFFCLDEEIDGVSDAPDEVRVQCADCKAIFTKEELLESNQDVINANIEDVAQELIKVFEKKLKKCLSRRAYGNCFINDFRNILNSCYSVFYYL